MDMCCRMVFKKPESVRHLAHFFPFCKQAAAWLWRLRQIASRDLLLGVIAQQVAWIVHSTHALSVVVVLCSPWVALHPSCASGTPG